MVYQLGKHLQGQSQYLLGSESGPNLQILRERVNQALRLELNSLAGNGARVSQIQGFKYLLREMGQINT